MSLFDPATGKLVDRDGLKGLQIRATVGRQPREVIDRGRDVRMVETLNDETGASIGYQTYHGSGRVDATVMAQAAVTTTSQGA